ERSLGFALASVIAQSMNDWECVVVDDGSVEPIAPLVESLCDARFRCVRLHENRGRGHARQSGLAAARGRLLAILDADDWMYPTRLETQLARLRSDRGVKLVGASMVLEDAEHRVLGVQPAAASAPRRLGLLPFSFAPILAEMSLARSIGFDARLTRSEDVL